MKKIKNIFAFIITIVGLVAFTIPVSVKAQQTGLSRTNLQQHDLGIEGQEVIQALVEIAPGAAPLRHKHPGVEVIYVLEGLIEYKVEGKEPVTLKAGDVLFIPTLTIHSARNVGSGNAIELATYIVEKGKPLLEIIK